jgi:hypothetical protein
MTKGLTKALYTLDIFELTMVSLEIHGSKISFYRNIASKNVQSVTALTGSGHENEVSDGLNMMTEKNWYPL